MAGGSESVAGTRNSPRISQIQKMKAAKRAEMAAVSKFIETEPEVDNREGTARAATGSLKDIFNMNTVHFVSNAHYYLFGPVPGFFFLMQC
jgi:hypothetical protein